MPYRAAISLLLLQHGASAFHTSPGRTSHASPTHLSRTALGTAALEAIPSLESILDDGRGHVNGDLARAIYEWEAAHGGHKDAAVQKEFSTRDGLRLVDELAREILTSLGEGAAGGDNAEGAGGTGKSGLSYNDLVQEGFYALLRAMATYDNYQSHAAAASTFEKYARDAIRASLLHFLAHSSRPIRLPLSLQTTLQAANAAARTLRKATGKEPTLVQVAHEVSIAPEQLALYRKLHRSLVSRAGAFVSVEDGMEVYDPTLAGVGVGNALHARRDSDSLGEMEGDEGGENVSPASMPASPSADAVSNDQDLIHLNSQEDDWERQPPERTVAPLRDALADTEEINNPLSYTHHQFLNEELDEFLKETLTPDELTVIQLRFGLVDSKHGGKGWTANQIATRMGMDHEDVVRVASAALEKLRRAASTNWEEESDAFVEVSL